MRGAQHTTSQDWRQGKFWPSRKELYIGLVRTSFAPELHRRLIFIHIASASYETVPVQVYSKGTRSSATTERQRVS